MDDDLLIRKVDTSSIIVFLGNIPNGLGDDHVIKLLHAAGNLRQWKRVKDNLGSMRSFGFVHFSDPLSVLRCDRILNNYSLTSPLGIEKKLVVRIDEKVKKQLDRWIQDNPKDGNAQFDAPYIAKVSAIAEELVDEKAMSYQLLNVEKMKTERSIRQIHEQRRKATEGHSTTINFQEKEDLQELFTRRLKQWKSRELEKNKNRDRKSLIYTRSNKEQLEKDFENWTENNHLYYRNKSDYLRKRRSIRIQEEREDKFDFRAAEEQARQLAERTVKRQHSGPDSNRKKVKLDSIDIPPSISLITFTNWSNLQESDFLSLKPMMMMILRKYVQQGLKDVINTIISALIDHKPPSDLYKLLDQVPTNDRIKFIQDIYRLLNNKSQRK